MLSAQFEYNDGLKKTRNGKENRNEMHVFLVDVLLLIYTSIYMVPWCYCQI